MSCLSEILKQRRKVLGLTLAQIAEKVGVTEATVQRWESGNIKTLRYDKVTKLAEVLKVSPSSIMGWEEAEEKNKPAEPELDELDKEFIRLAARLTPEQKRRQLEVLQDIVGQKDT